MGQYFKEHYVENVVIDDVPLPCPCLVEVSGGGKIIVSHNGIKEQTGWKEKRVTIKGRLEGQDEEDLNKQIAMILNLSNREHSLKIVSRETALYGITKIVMEDNPQMTAIEGYDFSRSLTLTGIEDMEAENTKDLRESKLASIMKIIRPKIKPAIKSYAYKLNSNLNEISTRVYGRKDLAKIIEAKNRDIIQSVQENESRDLVIPDLKTEAQDHVLTGRDSYASLSINYFGTADYKGKIKKANGNKSLVSGDTIIIPPLLTYEEKAFAEKVNHVNGSIRSSDK